MSLLPLLYTSQQVCTIATATRDLHKTTDKQSATTAIIFEGFDASEGATLTMAQSISTLQEICQLLTTLQAIADSLDDRNIFDPGYRSMMLRFADAAASSNWPEEYDWLVYEHVGNGDPEKELTREKEKVAGIMRMLARAALGEVGQLQSRMRSELFSSIGVLRSSRVQRLAMTEEKYRLLDSEEYHQLGQLEESFRRFSSES